MPLVYQAAMRSSSIPPAATFALALTALTYLRGWVLLRRAGVPFYPPWRALAFLAGLFSLWVALASPMDVFNRFVLAAHMLQHMTLMMVAPPLILLGAPVIPLVRGLPRFAAREFAGPFLNWRVAQKAGNTLTNPICALLLMGLVMFGWHTPGLYELALRSSAWHEVEHACFLLTSLIFWWPVIQPWPSKPQWPRWAMVPYLLVADLQNTALSAILVFSDRILYPTYAEAPRLFGFTALEDQAAAGASMWVVGSLAFIVPAVIIAVRCLSRKTSEDEISSSRTHEGLVADELLPLRTPLRRGLFPERLTANRREAISFAVLLVVVCSGFAWLFSSSATDSDDQALRTSQQTGAFAVSVFAAPGEVPAGATGFAILVQDRNTHEVLLDALVNVTSRLDDTRATSSTVRATRDDSENKLLYSAQLSLATAGNWLLNISVRRGSESAALSLPLKVVDPESGTELRWPYLVMFCFVAILVFAYAWRHRISPRR